MTVIKFENVSKKYKLYSKGGLYLRDRITHALQRLNPFNGHGSQRSAIRNQLSVGSDQPSAADTRHLTPDTLHPLERDFWALKNVSFEIKQGESVGFIGRNGAGKSTILKLLAGVTKATSGKVEVNGRVAALIEVGAGFHPELTGRENIYLNGSILGMTKAEIEKQFDSIVAFAELEQFIDTPVKHYSSGMYVRLGFAIAAHTNPDIYLIDEVLAVGDEAFQKKCLDTLAAHKAAGKTMILVSHQLPKIQEVCDRCVYVNDGEIRFDGPPEQAIDAYKSDLGIQSQAKNIVAAIPTRAQQEWHDPNSAPGNEVARLLAVRVRTHDGQILDGTDIRRPVGIEMDYEVLKPGHILIPNYHFHNAEGVLLFMVHDFQSEWRRKPRPLGKYTSTVWIPGNFLAEGQVIVSAAVCTYIPYTAVHFFARQLVAFQVVDSHDGDSARGYYDGSYPGIVRPVLRWMTSFHVSDGVTSDSPGGSMAEFDEKGLAK